MKQSLTFLLFGLLCVPAWAQEPESPEWRPSRTVRRNLVVKQLRLYAGFDLGGAYRNQIRYQDNGNRLGGRSWVDPELVPGLVIGMQKRRWSFETGMYNLPSTISYSLVVGPAQQQGAGLGLQYAQVPLRVKWLVLRPNRKINVNLQVGAAIAWNGKIRRGRFDRLSTAVVGTDTLGLAEESVMLHRVSSLVEGGGEIVYRLNSAFTVSGYVRQLVGLQTLWRKNISYQVNSGQPVQQARAETRATGTTFGFGIRYHFKLGPRYRSVFD
jgi:hypothetical protein